MVDDLDLDQRTAVVTGAGRNIGRAIALELAAHGANVVVNTRTDEAQAEAVVEEIRGLGADAIVVVGDVSDRDVVSRLAARALSRFGGVDICVSNAAARLHKQFDDTTDADWHRHLNMQLTASWYLAKAFVGGMRAAGWGRLIHIGGPDGWYGGQYRLPHAAGKGGLRAFTKGLAWELGPHGITVNEVIPGFTATTRDPTTHPQVTDEYTHDTVAAVPIRRQVDAAEVAWACLWLCSSRSGAVTGTALHVDGGKFLLG